MIEIQVPKDITTYKTKTVSPFDDAAAGYIDACHCDGPFIIYSCTKDRNLSAEYYVYSGTD